MVELPIYEWPINGGGHGDLRCCADAVNKISTCGVTVISNHTVCVVFVFHACSVAVLTFF